MDGSFRADATSRRGFLAAGAALAAAGAAAPLLTMPVQAQGGDPELSRLQSQRRIVLKGGVVLTLDRQVGDFAQADVLIEDGKIREIRPNIAVSADAAAVVDASNRIIIPGFVDTHSHSYQGLVRNIMANGLLNPDYNRDIQTTLTPVYRPTTPMRACSCPRSASSRWARPPSSTSRSAATRRSTPTP